MKAQSMSLALGMSVVSCLLGCGGAPGPASGSAAIVGRVVNGGAGKFQTTAQVVCPTLVVTLNGNAADVTVDDDCSFLINNVAPAASYVVGIELVDLEIAGTVTINNVAQAELIEIEVDADDDSLTIRVVRRATPDASGNLPSVIAQNQNNVEIFLQAGTYENDLTVFGNNFTLVGQAGDDCDDEGWTVLSGNIVINGNNATFRNILFLGNVQVSGNNTSFINVCFDGQLVIFGRNTDFNDDDDGDDDNSNDNDDDDGNDNDDDDGNGNDNDDDNENNNGNDNGNVNGNDNGNGNDNVDDGNQNSNVNSNQNGNDNSSDDNGNGNENDNGNDNNK